MKRKLTTFQKDLLLVLTSAFLFRLIPALPGILHPELLMRPDSVSYLTPAYSLLSGNGYSVNGLPTALRVPLYPLVLAAGLLLGGLRSCILLDLLLSLLVIPPVMLACREAELGRKGILTAGIASALSVTQIALAPAFLSDSLFSVLCAWELYFLLRYLLHGKETDLCIVSLLGGIGVLIRPLNLLWITGVLIAVLCQKKVSVRTRLRRCLISGWIFCAVFVPWICRNHAAGAGWRIDTVSADSLRHNASVVESRVLQVPAETLRKQYDACFESVFRSDPERYRTESARLDFQEQYLSRKLRKHFFRYLSGFFHPVLFVPDVPTLLENMGITTGNKGTWDVIVKEGLSAGIRHYFRGNTAAFVTAVVCSLLTLVWYTLALGGLRNMIRDRRYDLLALSGIMIVYYLLVVGPVAYPRFLLPAVPGLCFCAGWCFRTRRTTVPTPEETTQEGTGSR